MSAIRVLTTFYFLLHLSLPQQNREHFHKSILNEASSDRDLKKKEQIFLWTFTTKAELEDAAQRTLYMISQLSTLTEAVENDHDLACQEHF